MQVTIRDRGVGEQFRKDRAAAGADKYDEVWNGVLVVMPLPNDEHQEIVSGFNYLLGSLYGPPGSRPTSTEPGST